jgi:hypothetical protein
MNVFMRMKPGAEAIVFKIKERMPHSFIQVRLSVVADVQQLMWRIEDSVVQLKRLIADVVVTWNGKIQDLVLITKRRDEKQRKSDGGKPSAPTTNHSLECDVVSLKDIYLFNNKLCYIC